MTELQVRGSTTTMLIQLLVIKGLRKGCKIWSKITYIWGGNRLVHRTLNAFQDTHSHRHGNRATKSLCNPRFNRFNRGKAHMTAQQNGVSQHQGVAGGGIGFCAEISTDTLCSECLFTLWSACGREITTTGATTQTFLAAVPRMHFCAPLPSPETITTPNHCENPAITLSSFSF